MSIERLRAEPVERIWGRLKPPAAFAELASAGRPIGEIWHHDFDPQAPLLVKHIFTSEKLSIQVHPDDKLAHKKGLPSGKDEAWYILEAEPDARIGLGLTRTLSPKDLREAAEDGSIESLLDWRAVENGQWLHVPAGTIHAIGAGISLIEVQQNSDVTYRFFDYGRPRPLQVEEAVEAASAGKWDSVDTALHLTPGRTALSSGPKFVVEKWSFRGEAELTSGTSVLLIPLRGECEAGGMILEVGSVYSAKGTRLDIGDRAEVLAAYAADAFEPGLLLR